MKILLSMFFLLFTAGQLMALDIKGLDKYVYDNEKTSNIKAVQAFVACESCGNGHSPTIAPPANYTKKTNTTDNLKITAILDKPHVQNVVKDHPAEKTIPPVIDIKPITIYFDFGKDNLSNNEKNKIDEAIKDIKDLPVEITGYTCDIGSRKYNNTLALERAKSVAKYLNEMGVKNVETIGKGKCCYAEKKRHLNRRAVIKVIPIKEKKGEK